MKTLERIIVGLLALFMLLVTVVAVSGSVRAWATHDRTHQPPQVSKAEVVSMQPSVDKPPVILVLGPTGSEVKVSGTEDLKQPYPSEGDYIDVVFPRTGGAVIPPTKPYGDAVLATFLIIGIWLTWSAILLTTIKAGRSLINTTTLWQQRTSRHNTPRAATNPPRPHEPRRPQDAPPPEDTPQR